MTIMNGTNYDLGSLAAKGYSCEVGPGYRHGRRMAAG